MGKSSSAKSDKDGTETELQDLRPAETKMSDLPSYNDAVNA